MAIELSDAEILSKLVDYEDNFFEPAENIWVPIGSTPDVSYNLIDSNIEGNAILLSAPHAVNHCRHVDWFNFESGPPDCKPRDLCTGALIRTLQDITGLPIIYNAYKADDANYYHNLLAQPYASSYYEYTDAFDGLGYQLIPYKEGIKGYLNSHPDIKLVIDFHSVGYGYGCNSGEDEGSCFQWAVDLGTGGTEGGFDGLSLNSYFGQNAFEDIINTAFDNNNFGSSAISYNHFRGWVQNTVTRYSSNCNQFGVDTPDECVDAIQFELNTESICPGIANDETIVNVVKALVEIIEEVNSYHTINYLDDDKLYISEMQFDIPGMITHGNRNYPFIEFYNPTWHPIDISGWEVHNIWNCGDNWFIDGAETPACTTCTNDVLFTFPAGSVIYPKNYTSIVRRKETWLPLCDDINVWAQPGFCADGTECYPDIWHYTNGEVPEEWEQNMQPMIGWPNLINQIGSDTENYLDFSGYVNGQQGSTDCIGTFDPTAEEQCINQEDSCYNLYDCWDLGWISCFQCDYEDFSPNGSCAENCLPCFGAPDSCDMMASICYDNAATATLPGTNHCLAGNNSCNPVSATDCYCHPNIISEETYGCCMPGALVFNDNMSCTPYGQATNWSQCGADHFDLSHIRFDGDNPNAFEWYDDKSLNKVFGEQCGEYIRLYDNNNNLVTFMDLTKNQLHLHDDDWSLPIPEGVVEYGAWSSTTNHGPHSMELKFPNNMNGWGNYDNNEPNNWMQGTLGGSVSIGGVNQIDMDIVGGIVFGCIDSEADNYNANATIDDGSCTYPYVEPIIQTFALQLDSEGNNLISFPHELVDSSLQNLIDNNPTLRWNHILGQGVGLFNIDGEWSGNLQDLVVNSGYWFNVDGEEIDVDDPGIIYYDAYVNSEQYEYNLSTGNNVLVSYDGEDGINVIEAFENSSTNIEPFVEFILGQGIGLFNTCWSDCNQYGPCAQSPECGWSGNLNNLYHNKGYWINLRCGNDNNWCDGAETFMWYKETGGSSNSKPRGGPKPPQLMTHHINPLNSGWNYISFPFEMELDYWAGLNSDVSTLMSYLAWWGVTMGQGVGLWCNMTGDIDHENCSGNLINWDKKNGYMMYLEHANSMGATLSVPGHPIDTDITYDLSTGMNRLISFSGTTEIPILQALGNNKRYIEYIITRGRGFFNVCLTDWISGISSEYIYSDNCWVGNLITIQPYHAYWINAWCSEMPRESGLQSNCPGFEEFRWNV